MSKAMELQPHRRVNAEKRRATAVEKVVKKLQRLELSEREHRRLLAKTDRVATLLKSCCRRGSEGETGELTKAPPFVLKNWQSDHFGRGRGRLHLKLLSRHAQIVIRRSPCFKFRMQFPVSPTFIPSVSPRNHHFFRPPSASTPKQLRAIQPGSGKEQLSIFNIVLLTPF